MVVFCIRLRIPDSIGKDIEKVCQGIYPLHDVLIHKVKVLKKPKFDGMSELYLSYYLENFLIRIISDSLLYLKERKISQVTLGLIFQLIFMMKSPCYFSVGKLMELHGEGGPSTTTKTAVEGGEKVDRVDGYEPPVLETV